jgi:hypothetical protein
MNELLTLAREIEAGSLTAMSKSDIVYGILLSHLRTDGNMADQIELEKLWRKLADASMGAK